MLPISLFEPTFTTYLFYFFCLGALLQLLFVLLVFSRLGFYKKKATDLNNKHWPDVSVIICCRNESENLMKNLQTVLEQDYPLFEVIVVNHMSTDDSKYVLEAFKTEYEHLRIITINKDSHLTYGKKFPLSVGIKGAKNETLVLTDADCLPNSHLWLKKMIANYNEQNEMVIGYAPMNKEKGFLNFFIRMETVYIAVNYLSFALAKSAYMAVGRNLSYKKSLYNKVGFKSHYSVISGDDDLLVQEVATRKNVAIEIDEDTWCYSDAKDSWKDWFLQKRRHFTASPKYRVIKKLLLGSYNLSWLMTFLLFVILLPEIEFGGWVLLSFTSILGIKWLVFFLSFRKLKASKLAIWFPLWELIYLILIPFVYFAGNNTRGKQWK